MWERSEPDSFDNVRWQLSQIHLCVDVARLEPNAADVDRLVSRSLKRALHVPSIADVEAAAWGLDGEDLEGWDGEVFDGLFGQELLGLGADVPDEGGGMPFDLLMGHGTLEDGGDEGGDDEDEGEDRALGSEGDAHKDAVDPQDEDPADELGLAVHSWGRRVSGFSFSTGGELSAVWYDKLLEERLSGKRWMEPIHREGGWRSGMALTRIEARFRRGALRDLMALNGRWATWVVTLTEKAQDGAASVNAVEARPRWFDDPWVALEHLDDLWAYFAGLPPDVDAEPDVTWRGWMRLVVPEDGRR